MTKTSRAAKRIKVSLKLAKSKQLIKTKPKNKNKQLNAASNLVRGTRGKMRSKQMVNGVSMVSDGVNVGSIWKNTTAEKVTFPMAREKVFDLTSTGTTFQTLVQQYINPGNTQLFPIFSQIAKNYDEYMVNHLKFYYRTEEYMASGTVVSAGLAALGTCFDPDAPNFATMTELENYEHSISGPPFSGIIVHDVIEERKARGNARGGVGDLALKNYFVNYSPNQISPSATPAKFYDVGNFQLCVNGTQAGIIGELWVEYSFTLIRRLQQPGAVSGGIAHFSSTAATTANNFAAAALQAGNTLSGVTLGANAIVFPANQPGNYLITMSVAGATSASAFSLGSLGAGITAFNILSQSAARDATSEYQSLAGTTTSPAICVATVSVANSGGTLTENVVSTIVGAGTMDLFIVSLPSTVTLTVDEKEQQEIDNLVAANSALAQRLTRLEYLLTRPTSPCEEECKESSTPTDMEQSIHIDKSALKQLRSLLSK